MLVLVLVALSRIPHFRLMITHRAFGSRLRLGRIGWHTFRHSHSSLLHTSGVHLKVQQELLRHADIRTTMNIYTHAVPAALREANSKVVRLVLSAQEA